MFGVECLRTASGKSYVGAENTTEQGFVCQSWSSQTPNVHSYDDLSFFPDKTTATDIAQVHNYCRNVGAPLFGDEVSYQEELEKKTAALGLSDRVRFLGFREDIPSLLAAVDFVAHTSVAPEPFGRVIVEGMLAGKPVVATRAGGACEIIEDGITGRLVTPGDADELAKVLRALVEQPAEAARLALAGQAAARERFSEKAMLLGIEQAVAKTMTGR